MCYNKDTKREKEVNKMRWNDKMSEGMRLMREACSENENWNKCWDCPFDSICEQLMNVARAETIINNNDIFLDKYIPAKWKMEKRK